MLGKDPETLPFVRHDKLLEKLVGRYETYKGTMSLQVSRKGDGILLETKGKLLESSIPFLPEEVSDTYARFFTLQHSRKVVAEFFIEAKKSRSFTSATNLSRSGEFAVSEQRQRSWVRWAK